MTNLGEFGRDDHIGSRKAPSPLELVETSHVELYATELRLLLSEQAEIWNHQAAAHHELSDDAIHRRADDALGRAAWLNGKAEALETCAAQLLAIVEKLTP